MSLTNNIGMGARFLIVMAAFIVVVAGLKQAEPIVVPFLLSLFVAIVSIPGVIWLQRKRVPSALAIVIVLLVIVGLVTGVGALVGGSLNQFTSAVPVYQKQLEDIYGSLLERVASFGFDTSRSAIVEQLRSLIDPGWALGFLGGTLTRLASVVSNLFFILLLTVFILAEASHFPEKLRAAFGSNVDEMGRFSGIMDQIQEYLVIKTLVSLATGLLVGVWVWAWGVDFPFLWGVVAFILNYIPTLGSILAAIPPVALALIHPDLGWTVGLAVILGYIGVNLFLGNFVEPHFMGQKLGLSTLVVFLSLTFWGWIWGGVGMVLSVPLTMIVKILLQNSDDFHWIAVMLGPPPAAKEETAG